MSKRKRVNYKSLPEEKKVKPGKDPSGFFGQRPMWSFKKYDKDHPKWSFQVCDDIEKKIIHKLQSYEGMTWQEIQSASGAKKKGHGSNSHYEKLAEMSKEAQERARELKITADELFSLRLEGKARLYGVLEEGLFSVLWYDSEHEVYPI